jgi:hypothetical protein
VRNVTAYKINSFGNWEHTTFAVNVFTPVNFQTIVVFLPACSHHYVWWYLVTQAKFSTRSRIHGYRRPDFSAATNVGEWRTWREGDRQVTVWGREVQFHNSVESNKMKSYRKLLATLLASTLKYDIWKLKWIDWRRQEIYREFFVGTLGNLLSENNDLCELAWRTPLECQCTRKSAPFQSCNVKRYPESEQEVATSRTFTLNVVIINLHILLLLAIWTGGSYKQNFYAKCCNY